MVVKLTDKSQTLSLVAILNDKNYITKRACLHYQKMKKKISKVFSGQTVYSLTSGKKAQN